MNQVEPIIESITINEKIIFMNNLNQDYAETCKPGIWPLENFKILADQPICVLLTPERKERNWDLGSEMESIARKISNSDLDRKFLFRGVKLERLESVVTSGCDVIPTTSRIFATDYPNKALEYGEVVMVFDATKLEKTFVGVPKSENAETLSYLRVKYPLEREIGETLWFSLAPKDFRFGTSYEEFYSYYIPGNAREALLMIFLGIVIK